MKDILEIFKRSKVNIKDEKKLIEYINFCISKNIGKRINGKSSLHHILPQAKNLPFKKYSDLTVIKWNGVFLLYKDHYTAHYLLCNAIENISILSAFTAMNNCNLKLKRLEQADLIGKDQFQKVMELRSIKHSEHLKKEVIKDGVITSIAKEAAKKGQILMNEIIIVNGVETTRKKESAKKRKKLMYSPFMDSDGNITNMFKEQSRKYSKTITSEIEIDGKITTKAKLRSKKYSKTITSEIEIDGKITTKAKLRGRRVAEVHKQTGRVKGKNNPNAKEICVYDYNGNEIFTSVGNFVEMCNKYNLPMAALQQTYLSNTKLYQTNRAKSIANRYHNLHLIGYYARIKSEKYGFEPKDVMSSVSKKAKEFFFAVEQL